VSKHNQEIQPVVPDELKPFIDLIPKDKLGIAIARISQVSYSYSGPFPPPQMIEHYQKLHPEAARVLFERYEEQEKHRIELERLSITTQLKESTRGQIMGFVLALTFITSASYLALNGQPVVGGLFGSTTVLALVGMFVYGKKQQTKDLQSKD